MKEKKKTLSVVVCDECGYEIHDGMCSYGCKYDCFESPNHPARVDTYRLIKSEKIKIRR